MVPVRYIMLFIELEISMIQFVTFAHFLTEGEGL